ncbi:hypothetical protein WMF04_01165 [Sorangium sp. So ce260]|uniref:hypothetical protein n=1 Tax=Sorangium sp. So ce260 TaxID=3133291 RepID=UPI003F63CD1A
MNRQGAKIVFYFLAPLAPWRFETLLSSGGFNSFVVLGDAERERPQPPLGQREHRVGHGGRDRRGARLPHAAHLGVALEDVHGDARHLPISFQSFGSFSFTFAGGESFIASAASWPYVSWSLPRVTTPFAARHASGATFHRAAAARTSMSLAIAPTVR